MGGAGGWSPGGSQAGAGDYGSYAGIAPSVVLDLFGTADFRLPWPSGCGLTNLVRAEERRTLDGAFELLPALDGENHRWSFTWDHLEQEAMRSLEQLEEFAIVTLFDPLERSVQGHFNNLKISPKAGMEDEQHRQVYSGSAEFEILETLELPWCPNFAAPLSAPAIVDGLMTGQYGWDSGSSAPTAARFVAVSCPQSQGPPLVTLSLGSPGPLPSPQAQALKCWGGIGDATCLQVLGENPDVVRIGQPDATPLARLSIQSLDSRRGSIAVGLVTSGPYVQPEMGEFI